MQGPVRKNAKNAKKSKKAVIIKDKSYYEEGDEEFLRIPYKSSTMSKSHIEHLLTSLLEAIEAVRRGDLTKRLRKQRYDIFGEIADSYNGMMESLNSFTSEVTRLAREVGSEGKLGGQASVPNAAGTWKELTDNVNAMAANLTGQVRNIAQVTTSVANGDLTQKITVDAKGEVLELKNTINKMVDNLRAFSGEVTRVAKEVGTEGKLGGQAVVSGVTGTWKELTDNVNAMANQ